MSKTPAIAAGISKPRANSIVNNNVKVTVSKVSQKPPPPGVKEFIIRVPKNDRKKHHLMRFNGNLNVDFAQWDKVKLERENNMKEFRGMDDDMPRFGAGSEYNRDLREEARRKKFGIIAKKYNPEAQPWILNVGGKSGKKFRGSREGGINENAAYYVFAHAPDGAIEAYPVNEWYNFQPIQRYKSLSAEEAEQEFARRKKVMNLASIMIAKRRKDDEEENEDPGQIKSIGRKGKELKISDMDEWIDSDDDSDSDEEDKENKPEDSDNDERKKKTKKSLPKKKKKRDLDDEAFEESDDGDEEGRELDYISDSSEDEPDPEAKVNNELKSVAEEDALRNLLTSDEDEDDEKDSEEEKKSIENDNKDKETEDEKRKKLKKKRTQEKKDSSSDSSSDSSDSEAENNKKSKKEASGNKSKLASKVNASKRKAQSTIKSNLTVSENSNNSLLAKKQKLETPSLIPLTFSSVVNVNSKGDYGITEDAVKRYLMRKPVTTTEILSKFKNKAPGITSGQLVDTITMILKKINPVKQRIQDKQRILVWNPVKGGLQQHGLTTCAVSMIGIGLNYDDDAFFPAGTLSKALKFHIFT